MPKRPLNRCLHCNHTWFPRGSNLSRKCPACGVVFDDDGGDERPRSAGNVGLLLGGGCLGLVLLFCAGIFAAVVSPRAAKNDGDRPAEQGAADKGPAPEPAPAAGPADEFAALLAEFRADVRGAERRHKGRTVTVTGVVDSANWADKKSTGPHAILWVGTEKNVIGTFHGRTQVDDVMALKKGQRARIRGQILNASFDAKSDVLYVTVDRCELIAPLAGKTKVELPPPPVAVVPSVTAEVAPPPRRIVNAPAAGADVGWVRRGGTEVRLAGAVVARPWLVGRDGVEYRGPDPLLLVRLQARRLPGATPLELRRWLGALDAAARLRADRRELEPVRFGAAWLSGQIDGRVRLEPGGAAADDVLAFPLPAVPPERAFALVLAGDHVGESGEFVLPVPPAALGR